MKGNYIIKVEPGEGCNEEFAPDESQRKGVELGGYFLIGFDRDGDPKYEAVASINVMNVANMLAFKKTKAVSVLWQAFAIAEGLRKATEIEKKNGLPLMSLSGVLEGMDGDFRTELLRKVLGRRDDTGEE